MSTLPFAVSNAEITQFAEDVRRGLGAAGQKSLPSTYLYDAVGSALFDAITLLPEYGLTSADERLLRLHASEIVSRIEGPLAVVELGSGSGRKTRHVLEALGNRCTAYYPIDVSVAALDVCAKELSNLASIRPVRGSYLQGLSKVIMQCNDPILVLFLGSTIGNFGRHEAAEFLQDVRAWLNSGDHLLVGADLVKPVERMITAYDDPIGVTSAFNLNMLARVNRELGGTFDIRLFQHEARWHAGQKRIEMHLRALRQHTVHAAGTSFQFRENETIWTESSHKFDLTDLEQMALRSGWVPVHTWFDEEWPFANCLWRV